MGNVIVPQANQRERAAFASVDIKLIESIREEEFLRVIIDFLKTQRRLFHDAEEHGSQDGGASRR